MPLRTLSRMGMATLLVWWPSAISAWQIVEPAPAVSPSDAPGEMSSLVENWDSENFSPSEEGRPERRWWVPTAFTGQMVWLNRTGADQSVVLTGGVPGVGGTVHSTAVAMSDLVFRVEAGVRGSVLLGRLGGWQPELAYLGIFDQNAVVRYAPEASTGVAETNSIFFDAILTNPVTDITVAYESDLHSTECNFWYDDLSPIQLMLGGRWIQQSEQFEQFETANWSDGTLADLRNNLLGGQIGLRSYLFERGRWSVFALAKGGVYYNRLNLSADVEGGGVVLSSFQRDGSATSYAGEINLTAMWQWTPYCNFHAGYTGLFLTQVALAGDQLDNFSAATGTGVFDYGQVSYQGGHFGMTFSW